MNQNPLVQTGKTLLSIQSVDNVNKEILLITQEECAEVSQAISKVFRFGLTESHPITKINNQAHLEEEIGDLLCMIQLMMEYKIIDKDACEAARLQKLNKLIKWSTIFKEETE